MDWFQLSYHSIGLLTITIISLLIAVFLLTKKDKTGPTWWFAGFFTGFVALTMGYFMAYSVYAPWAAYHRYFTVGIVFGIMSMIQFSYNYPRNEHPKESKIVLIISFLASFGIWAHFIFKTIRMEQIYNFDAHFYTYDYGKEAGAVIALEFLWVLVVLLRKTILYSEYTGFLNNALNKEASLNIFRKIQNLLVRFPIGIVKVFKPKGRDAAATRAFAVGILLAFLVAILNVFVKSGAISYETYAFIFSSGTLITLFTILLIYINNSPEPTTFMVKLVGISLVTILLVIGTVSNVTLALSESGYDKERLAEIEHSKSDIIAQEIHKLPDTVQYIVTRSASGGLFSEKYDLLFAREEGLTQSDFIKSDSHLKKILLEDKIAKIQKKNKGLSLIEASKIGLDEINKSNPPVKERHSRILGKFFNNYAFLEKDIIYEVGFSYDEYRKYTHSTAIKLFY
ncbi:MAG: hypothetical protein K8R21_15500, partial [Leptospira sp.]|nr:hypothetical protein [Leptospira sp.]